MVQTRDDDGSPVALSTPTVALSNGRRMPLLGLGTTHSGGYRHETVVHALRHCGYRLLDTARRYGVEDKLALAIQESGVPRADLTVISKLWPADFASPRQALLDSCRRLGTDYLDVYLVHFPEVPAWLAEGSSARRVRETVWRELELLYDEGRCLAIGVSNYDEADLAELLEYATVRPHTNQCEFHPFYNPAHLKQYCTENGILFSGYCPLAKGRILDEAIVREVARQCNATPAQVCIRWSIQNGVPAIPKSLHRERVAENAKVWHFELPPEAMAELSALHDPACKVVCLDREVMQRKYSLPCGYKLPL